MSIRSVLNDLIVQLIRLSLPQPKRNKRVFFICIFPLSFMLIRSCAMAGEFYFLVRPDAIICCASALLPQKFEASCHTAIDVTGVHCVDTAV